MARSSSSSSSSAQGVAHATSASSPLAPLVATATFACAAAGFLYYWVYHKPTFPSSPPTSSSNSNSSPELSSKDQKPTTVPQIVVVSAKTKMDKLVQDCTSWKNWLLSSWKRRSGKPVLTISVKNILLWNPSKDPAQPNFAFLPSIPHFLHQLLSTNVYETYFIAATNSVSEQSQISSLLSGIVRTHDSQGADRIVFVESDEAKQRVIESLDASIHVDADDAILESLVERLPQLRFVRVWKRRRSRNGSELTVNASPSGSITPSYSSNGSSASHAQRRPSIAASHVSSHSRTHSTSSTRSSTSDFTAFTNITHDTVVSSDEIAIPVDEFPRLAQAWKHGNVECVRSVVDSEVLSVV